MVIRYGVSYWTNKNKTFGKNCSVERACSGVERFNALFEDTCIASYLDCYVREWRLLFASLFPNFNGSRLATSVCAPLGHAAAAGIIYGSTRIFWDDSVE